MAETDMFRWRCQLEKRLDALHDQTAAFLFDGNASVQDDVQRHRVFSCELLVLGGYANCWISCFNEAYLCFGYLWSNFHGVHLKLNMEPENG